MAQKARSPIVNAVRSFVGTKGLAGRLTKLEAGMARLEAGLASQPQQQPEPQQPQPLEPVTVPASIDINFLLHHSRGALLRSMPPGARRLLSAGCAGTWYFNWIQETYGSVEEHLGIEYFMPKPDDLPANVVWIQNTVSDMSAVETASCDLVFSGENLEHLWPEDVAGFALESARVLKPGGHVVVDSPNRLMTAPLNWSHPEHTIELTEAEARRLLELAGFDITASYGIWLCRDARDGRILPFDPNQECDGWSVTERILCARDNPADSFIWWVEAVRTDRPPDAAAVHAHMADLFAKHWPERIQRLLVPAGHQSHQSPEGEWVESQPGQGGPALYGPYMPLWPGRYRVSWQVAPAADARSPVAVCDVVARDIELPLARHEVVAGDTRVTLEFALPEMTFGLQYRCLSTGGEGFSVLRRIELEKIDG